MGCKKKYLQMYIFFQVGKNMEIYIIIIIFFFNG